MAAYARFMTHVTCRLTAENRDQLWNHMLGNRVWATFTFTDINGVAASPYMCMCADFNIATAVRCMYHTSGICDFVAWQSFS